MKEAKRYEDEIYGPSNYDFEESEKGTWVKYTDHNEIVSALKAERDALAAENAALKEWAKDTEELWVNDCDLDSHLDCVPENPATDAYLNSVRAEGVEMVKAHPAISLCSLTHVCEEIASQLRAGEPS